MTLRIFLLALFIGAAASSVRAQTSIPNELGAPKAGGLPREQSSNYEILYGSVRVGQDIQRVIVTKPFGSIPRPAVFLVGGMGCYSLDFSGTGPKVDAYYRTIDFMARLGFVTMRVEKTGMGDSVGTPCAQQDFHREVAGYMAGLQALTSYSFVERDQIYLFGHSIGGVIAPFLAEKINVKGVAVIGTLATNWHDYDLTNVRRQYQLGGMSGEPLEEEVAKTQVVALEFYKYKKSPDQIIQEHPELADAVKQEYEAEKVSYLYMQELSEVNPVQDWNRSQTPVLILSGSSDFIGSQYEELKQMTQQANETRSVPLELKQIQNLDHFFRNAASEQESYNSQHADGTSLSFQNSLLTVLQNDFLGL